MNKRKKITAEEFTPEWLANHLIDELLKCGDFLKSEYTYLDPACGEGSLLCALYQRRLKNNQNPIDALKSIYGCDIMIDNIEKCKSRLLNICPINDPEILQILENNIIHIPIEKYPRGSLDFLVC
jgi:type I restriction-modification system DNA methylase subunit